MLAEKIRKMLHEYVDTYFNGNVSKAAASLDISNDTFRTWYLGTRSPLDKIGPIIEKLVGDNIGPEELIRLKVEFVNDKLSGVSKEEAILQQKQTDKYESEIERLKQKIADLEERLADSKETNTRFYNLLQNRQSFSSEQSFFGSNMSTINDDAVDKN